MERQTALILIADLVSAEVEVVKQANRGNGTISKKAEKEEANSAKALFVALVGEKPTAEEIQQMVRG